MADMSIKSLSAKVLRYNMSRRVQSTFQRVPNDNLTLKDFLPTQNTKNDIIERRTSDGRLRLPEWLKKDVIAREKDVG